MRTEAERKLCICRKAESAEGKEYSFRGLLSAVKLEDDRKMEKRIRQFLEVLRAGKLPLSQYRLAVMELATELLRVIKVYGLEEVDELSQQMAELAMLQNLRSSSSAIRWIPSCG